jgi:hypothetical protein
MPPRFHMALVVASRTNFGKSGGGVLTARRCLATEQITC